MSIHHCKYYLISENWFYKIWAAMYLYCVNYFRAQNRHMNALVTKLVKSYWINLTSLKSCLFNTLHITLISSNGIVYLDQLSGDRYCISGPAIGYSSYTHISYHNKDSRTGMNLNTWNTMAYKGYFLLLYSAAHFWQD